MFQYQLIPTQGFVDSGLKFPTPSDDSNRSKGKEAPSTWWPRTITIPTYPHLIMASNGYIFRRSGSKHVDPDFPGLRMTVNMMYLWRLPEENLPSRLLSTLAFARKSRRRDSMSSTTLSGLRLLLPADELWYDDTDNGDSEEGGDRVDFELTNKTASEPIEPYYNHGSMHQWNYEQPSPPLSPPQTPRLVGYRNETPFAPTDQEWLAWNQTWRDVAIQPLR